jgi:hypothetical protein
VSSVRSVRLGSRAWSGARLMRQTAHRPHPPPTGRLPRSRDRPHSSIHDRLTSHGQVVLRVLDPSYAEGRWVPRGASSRHTCGRGPRPEPTREGHDHHCRVHRRTRARHSAQLPGLELGSAELAVVQRRFAANRGNLSPHGWSARPTNRTLVLPIGTLLNNTSLPGSSGDFAGHGGARSG